MKFLIVFSALAALAAAKPGVLSGLGYSAGHFNGFGYSTHTAAVPYAATVAHSPIIAASAHAVPAVVAATPVVAGVKTQYHSQDILGQASYGHSEPFQAHSAVQDAHGNKVGSFSYVAPDGQIIKTDYVADALGYRVASNALPVGPGAGPVPVHDTPEVIAARAAHLAAHYRAKRGIAAVAIGHTPAATAPLAHTAVVHSTGLSYAAPLAYSTISPVTYSHSPLAYSTYSHGLTSVVSSPLVPYIH